MQADAGSVGRVEATDPRLGTEGRIKASLRHSLADDVCVEQRRSRRLKTAGELPFLL